MATADTTRRATDTAVGHLLKRLRLAAELTQEELAERAGVSARLVSDLERGVIHRPRRDTVQLLADGLRLAGADRAAFTALARGRAVAGEATAADTRPRQTLPLPPGPLVGREREVAAAVSLLRQPDATPSGSPSGYSAVRLLTLTGPGGVGKTRLALDVAARTAGTFPCGVVFVDLAPVADPHLLLPAIGQTLGLRAGGAQPLRERLVGALQGQRLLLLLDNVEHLALAAPVVADLLGACPELTALATSRQPLRIRVEREYQIEPLALPDLDRLPPSAELARIPAVDLLVRRAEAARRGFALTAENARAMAEIAVRLDGLPLAIELAAARMKVLSPSTLLAHLEHRLAVLTGGARDLPARQQTLRATLDWSYDLLTVDDQRLFRRLAVFAGGFSLDAAEALCRERVPHSEGTRRVESRENDDSTLDSRLSTLDSLGALVEKSLVRVLETEDGEARFGMLETMREYGLERLAAAAEETEARQRHAAWCLDLSEHAEPELRKPDQERWLARLDAELGNLRAALGWALDQGHAESALRLGGALWQFWANGGHYAEGRRWLERALTANDGVPPAVRAKALLGIAAIAHYQGDYGPATARGEEALALYRALGDTAGVASSRFRLGLLARIQGDFGRATAHGEAALAGFRALGNQVHVAAALNGLGLLAYYQGDYARAAPLHGEALALQQAGGDRNGIALSLGNLGLVAYAQDDHERAAALQQEALLLERLLGRKIGVAHGLENLALIAAATRQPERAVRLFGAAEALRARIGAPSTPSDRDFNERLIAAARAQLGEPAFAAVWEEGRGMSLEEAIAAALERSREASVQSQE